MTTEAEDALADLYEGRSEAGIAGFRPHSVAVVATTWTGQHTGEGSGIPESTPIVEANSQPPRVRWLNSEEIALANLGSGIVEIGPITPAFSGGGTDLETLAGDIQTGATRYVLITGPQHPSGAIYRITDISAERPLRYMLKAAPTATEPA
jgi:hypothetical protein